jgi:hypothetical protein
MLWVEIFHLCPNPDKRVNISNHTANITFFTNSERVETGYILFIYKKHMIM